MISYTQQHEVKKYIEGNLNVQVSFRPWLKGMIADVQFPYGGIEHTEGSWEHPLKDLEWKYCHTCGARMVEE